MNEWSEIWCDLHPNALAWSRLGLHGLFMGFLLERTNWFASEMSSEFFKKKKKRDAHTLS